MAYPSSPSFHFPLLLLFLEVLGQSFSPLPCSINMQNSGMRSYFTAGHEFPVPPGMSRRDGCAAFFFSASSPFVHSNRLQVLKRGFFHGILFSARLIYSWKISRQHNIVRPKMEAFPFSPLPPRGIPPKQLIKALLPDRPHLLPRQSSEYNRDAENHPSSYRGREEESIEREERRRRKQASLLQAIDPPV